MNKHAVWIPREGTCVWRVRYSGMWRR